MMTGVYVSIERGPVTETRTYLPGPVTSLVVGISMISGQTVSPVSVVKSWRFPRGNPGEILAEVTEISTQKSW
jgi:hypothetical protein